MRPGDGEVPKMLARLYHRAGEPLKAITELEQHIERNPGECLPGQGGVPDQLFLRLSRDCSGSLHLE